MISLIAVFSLPVIALWLLTFACAWRCGYSMGCRDYGRAAMWAAGVSAAFALITVIYAMGANWFVVPLYAGAAAFWAWISWRNWRRRKRKRSLKALGEKTRKVFAAMARNMPRPGPVLRPAPQGARA